MLDQLDQMQVTAFTPFSCSAPEPVNEIDLSEYQPLHVGRFRCLVASPLMDGCLAACKAYADMAEQDEYGPFLFLTGYEYAHLARQHLPAGLTPAQKGDWQRGFIMGWVACVLGL